MVRGQTLFLRIVLSCLYFIPGAMLLHGSLWIVTRGKHDFYDVLKVMSLVCLAFIVFVDGEVFNYFLLYPYVSMNLFYERVISSDFLAWMVGVLVLAVEISFVHILPCAWLVKLHGHERLGLKRALSVFLGLLRANVPDWSFMLCGYVDGLFSFRLHATFVNAFGGKCVIRFLRAVPFSSSSRRSRLT